MKNIFVEIILPDVIADITIAEAKTLGIEPDEYYSNMIKTTVSTMFNFKAAKELLHDE